MTSFTFKVLHRHTCAVLVLLVALLACGCSSFNREWRRAGKQPVALNSLEGRWQGRWLSDVNGHNGDLRCLITREEEGKYAARFRASYMWLLRFSYTVRLEVQSQEGGWLFQGQEDLGKLAGGLYHYEGNATQTNFHSTYRSPADEGVFAMQRIMEGD